MCKKAKRLFAGNPKSSAPAVSLLSKEQTYAKKAERLENTIYTAFSPVISRVHSIPLACNIVCAVEKASVVLTDDPLFHRTQNMLEEKLGALLIRLMIFQPK